MTSQMFDHLYASHFADPRASVSEQSGPDSSSKSRLVYFPVLILIGLLYSIVNYCEVSELDIENFVVRRRYYLEFGRDGFQLTFYKRFYSLKACQEIKRRYAPKDYKIATAHRWHFVSGFRFGVTGWRGEAKPLFCLLDSDHCWIEWSQENPECARITWKNFFQALSNKDWRSQDPEKSVSDPENISTVEAFVILNAAQEFRNAEMLNKYLDFIKRNCEPR